MVYYINSSTDTLAVAPGTNRSNFTTVGLHGVVAAKANGFEITAEGVAVATLLSDSGTAS